MKLKRRRSRQPFTLEEAKRHLSDLMWLITYMIHEREGVDLAEVCKATHAFSQAANTLKALNEADALEEIDALRERVHALEESRIRA